MNVIAISEVKTADLLTFFNTHIERKTDGKQTKKFADRASAEKRVDDLVAYLTTEFEEWKHIPEGQMPAPEGYEGVELVEPEEDPEVEATKAKNGASAFNMLVAGVAAATAQAAETGEPIVGVTKSSTKASNSEGVAASWADNEVRASRLKRDGVMVECDGQSHGPFKSTYEAFRSLRLPNNKHIRFRLKLKEAFRDKGEGAVFEHNGKKYSFTIVPGSAE